MGRGAHGALWAVLCLTAGCGSKDGEGLDSGSADSTADSTPTSEVWAAEVVWTWSDPGFVTGHAVALAEGLACVADPERAVWCWPTSATGEVSTADASHKITGVGAYVGLTLEAPGDLLCVSDEYAGPGRGACTPVADLSPGEQSYTAWPVQLRGMADQAYATSGFTLGDVDGDGVEELLTTVTDGDGSGVYAVPLEAGEHYLTSEHRIAEGCEAGARTYCATDIAVADGRLYIGDWSGGGAGQGVVYDLPLTGTGPALVESGLGGWDVDALGAWAVISSDYTGEAVLFYDGVVVGRLQGSDDFGKGVALVDFGGRVVLAIGAKSALSGEARPLGQVSLYVLEDGALPTAPVLVLDGSSTLGWCGYSLDVREEDGALLVLAGCVDAGGRNPTLAGRGAAMWRVTVTQP